MRELGSIDNIVIKELGEINRGLCHDLEYFFHLDNNKEVTIDGFVKFYEKFRLGINALLIGETGLDKSPMLRAAVKLVAKSRYASALNSSIRSLIGIADKEDDNIMLRLGPVASSSGAICAIDEIGRMNHEDQGHLLSTLQEGKMPFAKHGFNTVLDGSATFIMSANPTHDGT